MGMLSQYKTHLKTQIESKWETATLPGRVILMGELAHVLGSDLGSELKRANGIGWIGEPVLMALSRAMFAAAY